MTPYEMGFRDFNGGRYARHYNSVSDQLRWQKGQDIAAKLAETKFWEDGK